MVNIMNNSFLLKREGHQEEALECDLIMGTLLICNKRTIQAVEMIRKVQTKYLQVIDLKLKDRASGGAV
jgi:hypothetical protein